jgi:hypothetical protein
MVTKECGDFLFVDTETREKSRMDVARVKLSCSLLGTVDKVVSVMVEGVSTVIRILKESCVFGDD